jgi:hypothetical protein
MVLLVVLSIQQMRRFLVDRFPAELLFGPSLEMCQGPTVVVPAQPRRLTWSKPRLLMAGAPHKHTKRVRDTPDASAA